MLLRGRWRSGAKGIHVAGKPCEVETRRGGSDGGPSREATLARLRAPQNTPYRMAPAHQWRALTRPHDGGYRSSLARACHRAGFGSAYTNAARPVHAWGSRAPPSQQSVAGATHVAMLPGVVRLRYSAGSVRARRVVLTRSALTGAP